VFAQVVDYAGDFADLCWVGMLVGWVGLGERERVFGLTSGMVLCGVLFLGDLGGGLGV
jgi:hypothetical protein